MKLKAIISFIVLVAATILYFFGACDMDIWMYSICIAVVVLAMLIFMYQEKQIQKINDKKYLKQ